MVEEVGLDKLAVLPPLQCQHIPSCCIHQDHPHILPVVQVAVEGGKGIVVAVKFLAQFVIGLLVLLLVGIQFLVHVAHGNVLTDAVGLLLRHDKRDKGCTRAGNALQMADIAVLVLYYGAVAVVRPKFALKGFRLHDLCLGAAVLSCRGLPFCLSLSVRTLQSLCFCIGFNTLLSSLQKLAAALGCQVHHHLIETVDGRVLFPVQ